MWGCPFGELERDMDLSGGGRPKVRRQAETRAKIGAEESGLDDARASGSQFGEGS